MNYSSIALSTLFAVNYFFGSLPPILAPCPIKTQAVKIIQAHQELRKIYREKIKKVHEKEIRKSFKAKLDHILCLSNKAYDAECQEFANSLLKKAHNLLEQAKYDPLVKPLRAAL